MFSRFVAFRFAILGVLRKDGSLLSAAGIAAGTAAGCTLLTAPVGAGAIRVVVRATNEAGDRWKKAAALLVPVGSSVLPSPRFIYQRSPADILQCRAVSGVVPEGELGRRTSHDFDVFTAWIDSVTSISAGALRCLWTCFRGEQERMGAHSTS